MPNPKPRNQVKPCRKPTAQQITVRVALISAGAAIIAALIGVVPNLLASPPSSPNANHKGAGITQSHRTLSLLGPTLEGALAEIRSSDSQVRDRGVFDLGLVYATNGPAIQGRIIGILAQYVIDYAPAKPNGANIFAYCTASPPPSYPPDLTEALRIIGNRSGRNADRAVNLSDINLGYAVMDGLNLAHVNFDNDLLCRVISYGSSFQNASFQGADLRFAIVMNAHGLTTAQLRASYSLCKAQLPRAVFSKRVEYLTRKGRPLCL